MLTTNKNIFLLLVMLLFSGITAGKSSAQTSQQRASANSIAIPSGIYYAQGSMYAGSRREVLSIDDRTCMKVVEGTPTPYSGTERITISSVSFFNNKPYIDATNDAFNVYIGAAAIREAAGYGGRDSSVAFQYDGSPRAGLWELREATVEADIGRLTQDPQIQACLRTQGEYSHSMDGEFVPGNL